MLTNSQKIMPVTVDTYVILANPSVKYVWFIIYKWLIFKYDADKAAENSEIFSVVNNFVEDVTFVVLGAQRQKR